DCSRLRASLTSGSRWISPRLCPVPCKRHLCSLPFVFLLFLFIACRGPQPATTNPMRQAHRRAQLVQRLLVRPPKPNYNAAASTAATALSCSPDPPLTPIAPTALPSFSNGMPPAKTMILPLLDAWIPKNCPPDR